VSSRQQVSFATNSDVPAIRAATDVVLLLGRAMLLHFPAFLKAQEGNSRPSPYQVVKELAETFARELHKKNITNITQAVNVWQQFTFSGTFDAVSDAGKKEFAKVEQQIAADATSANAGIGETILWDANLQAADWIKKRILPHLGKMAFAAAPLVIDYDELGTQFCASSSPLRREIHWTLQPFEHSLLGAMVVPRILEHEYFSHLMPRNQHLSNGVREIVLVEVLKEEHRNDPNFSREAMKLDDWFRIALELHSYRNPQTNREELRDFEEVAVRLRRKSVANFWKMTAEILRLPSSQGNADAVDRVLTALRTLPDEDFDLLTQPWRGFAGTY
jgi:hypothetical protein